MALKSEDSPAPVMYLLWEDHKPFTTVPPTRPVRAATVGPLTRASEVVTIILTAIMDDADSVVECSNSEEMQRAMLDANRDIKDQGIKDPVLFSMDIRSLNPSLALDDILDVVMAIVEDTKLTLEGVDAKHLATYLVVMVS